MKLIQEQFQFIDNYLLNSGVEYLDVRMEMNDHIASAIEDEMQKDTSQTFYEVFKNYMICNKKSLLQNCDLQERKLRQNIITSFLKNCMGKEVLVLLFIVFFVNSKFDLFPFQEYFSLVSLVMFVAVLCYYFIAFKKVRKMSTGKLLKGLIGLLFYSVFYTQNIFGLLLVFPLLLVAESTIESLKKRIKEEFSVAVEVVVVMFVIVVFGFFIKWSQQFVTNTLVTFHFLFQFILWYVLLKTLLGYRKELSKKYKLIFETTV